ncbi:4'-phosphopantetheinyl transferase family protein [Streptomyces sp. NRRL F-525]|uniref:4'-phosphopantetheinyl transferase family protein n=1 Tax=Streptomyces sp. NRRL F-525 TaxID=1463861 RepID=UPI001F46A3B2|nr:4'-phosphopantetheinyl transferase superfamily protein [Streptomyces sp. NRRL F-525]
MRTAASGPGPVNGCALLSGLLPVGVVVAEARGDEAAGPVHPEEAAQVGSASVARRREFLTTRSCARRALAALGQAPGPIPVGPHREPCWPAGFVGSLTHCDGYRAAAVARASDVWTLGIDAEPDGPMPEGVLRHIALPAERRMVAELTVAEPDVHWDRLLFSAKESLYKAWFPRARRWLDFLDAELTFAAGRPTFTARVLQPGRLPFDLAPGRWARRDGLLLTAVSIATPPVRGAARDGGIPSAVH